ncbi:hypothetical protein CDAR_600571 [Caerostris darwini]|uniref:Uncharacterized protein n=1 Tax=Caerostris darwini TaxID=1538125 RepID=A0AAV4TTH0_9ARAC|nr:hypothetical protein CDAR_600571 [Caerostris darwini]
MQPATSQSNPPHQLKLYQRLVGDRNGSDERVTTLAMLRDCIFVMGSLCHSAFANQEFLDGYEDRNVCNHLERKENSHYWRGLSHFDL